MSTSVIFCKWRDGHFSFKDMASLVMNLTDCEFKLFDDFLEEKYPERWFIKTKEGEARVKLMQKIEKIIG